MFICLIGLYSSDLTSSETGNNAGNSEYSLKFVI